MDKSDWLYDLFVEEALPALDRHNGGSGDSGILVFYNKTMAASAWVSDSAYSDYPYRAAVVCSGVTTAHTPYVMFSEEDAALGILSRDANSYAGGIYIYASEIPESAISIDEIICIEE